MVCAVVMMVMSPSVVTVWFEFVGALAELEGAGVWGAPPWATA